MHHPQYWRNWRFRFELKSSKILQLFMWARIQSHSGKSLIWRSIATVLLIYALFLTRRGKLSPFRMSSVDMVETLLGLLEHLEERMGNFTSHLTTKFSLDALHMIISTTAGTICISAWNITFTRETPGHLEYFRSGGFSVQMSEDNPFGRIPVDQTSEETVNKDTQTSRGTKGQSTA